MKLKILLLSTCLVYSTFSFSQVAESIQLGNEPAPNIDKNKLYSEFDELFDEFQDGCYSRRIGSRSPFINLLEEALMKSGSNYDSRSKIKSSDKKCSDYIQNRLNFTFEHIYRHYCGLIFIEERNEFKSKETKGIGIAEEYFDNLENACSGSKNKSKEWLNDWNTGLNVWSKMLSDKTNQKLTLLAEEKKKAEEEIRQKKLAAEMKAKEDARIDEFERKKRLEEKHKPKFKEDIRIEKNTDKVNHISNPVTKIDKVQSTPKVIKDLYKIRVEKNCGKSFNNLYDLEGIENFSVLKNKQYRINFLCRVNTDIYFSPKLKERGLTLKIIDNQFKYLEKLKTAQSTNDYSAFNTLINTDENFIDKHKEISSNINIAINVSNENNVSDFASFKTNKVGLNSAFGKVLYLSSIYFVNTCSDPRYGLKIGEKVPTRSSSLGWGMKSIPFNHCHNMLVPAYNNIYYSNVYFSSYLEKFNWFKEKSVSNIMEVAKFHVEGKYDVYLGLKNKELKEKVEFGEISEHEAEVEFNRFIDSLSDEYYKLLIQIDELFENVLELLKDKGINYWVEHPK